MELQADSVLIDGVLLQKYLPNPVFLEDKAITFKRWLFWKLYVIM